jgi:DNA-binding LytR/AlgR family response regulator
MINILIVDDEPLALDILEAYISRLPDLNLVQRCNNAIEANEALKNNSIDLMFLDIQMPQLTGVEFLKSLTKPPLVVFTTAYSNYAIESYELNVVDYLLKPIPFDRFMKAVNKATEQIELHHKAEHVAEETHHEPDGPDHFFVKSDKKFVRIKYHDILYIEGLKDYVIIRMDSSRVITLQTMKSLEERMPSNLFRRIHRSYIVNVDRITAIDGNMVELLEKGVAKHIPIGKNYRDELLEMIEKNKL